MTEKLNIDNLLHANIFCKEYSNCSKELDGILTKLTFDSDEPNYLCIIAGCSGSGKTYFEKQLVETYPQYFNKLPQITTRERRYENEDSYYFVNHEIYKYMKDSLIARLDFFNGKQYGTIPVFENKKINTVIASYDAIEDLFELIDGKKLFIVPIMLLFDITEENLTKDGKRLDRDSSFLEKERKELLNVFNKYKNRCIFSKIYRYEDYGRFAEISDIVEI